MNIRFTVLLVVILVIIGGTVWITQMEPDENTTERKSWAWKVELEDLQHIAITHEDTSVAYRRQDRSWVIESEAGNDIPVYQPKWGGKALIVSGPKPSRTLDEDTADPALYGLDPVATTVEVTDRSGQSVTFELGAITPDAANQYVRLDDGSLHTLPKIWGEVVVSLATRPPYWPPFISILDSDEVVETRIQVRTENAQGAKSITAEVIYLLTGLEEGEAEAGVPEQWILLEGDGVLVNERWAELTSGLDDASLQTEETTFEDIPGLESIDWDIRLDVRSRDDTELAYFVYRPTPDPSRHYFWPSGDDTLSTVNTAWVDTLITLAEQPTVNEAPPDSPAN